MIQIAIIIIISHPRHCHLRIVLHLIELNGAVELCELLLQQLQVGVHEAQLQRHRLLHLLVCRSPANFNSTKIFSVAVIPLSGLSTNLINIIILFGKAFAENDIARVTMENSC